MATNRQIFATRVLDNGDGSGTVEYELAGSGIASVPCSIRKEAWTQTSGPTVAEVEDAPISGTNK